MNDLPSYAVTYVKHPELGWMPTVDDSMPASLAAHLIIDIHDLTPDEIARGQAVAAAFEGTGRVGDFPEFMPIEEAQRRNELERIARMFEI